MCWSFLPNVRFLIFLTVFELLPKTCNFTICSILSNSGHVGWCTASPDTILKLDTLVMIQTKFGFHWSSTFRGEDFWKRLRRTTDDDVGRQVMAIAHLTLWVRWAKKKDIFFFNFQLIVSNAFSMSIDKTIHERFSSSARSITSRRLLILSPIYRPFIKPDWLVYNFDKIIF